MKNYRPVSNLPFLSKVLERVVASRLNKYLADNDLHPFRQSTYRAHRSVQTAFLVVHDDITSAVDHKEAVVLTPLDLSAAFDTIDHQILLRRLDHDMGIRGVCLKWFESYLRDRSQAVHLSSASSEDRSVAFGVPQPQGSVLGLLLFTLCSSPVSAIAHSHGLGAHFYADDSQLYVAF